MVRVSTLRCCSHAWCSQPTRWKGSGFVVQRSSLVWVLPCRPATPKRPLRLAHPSTRESDRAGFSSGHRQNASSAPLQKHSSKVLFDTPIYVSATPWSPAHRMTKRPPMSFQPFALPLSSTYEQPASTGGVPQNRCRAVCWRVASAPVLPRCEARCFFRHASDIGRSTSLAPCILCRYGSEHRNGGRTVPVAASLASLVGDARGCP
jgi:hypothetical protein